MAPYRKQYTLRSLAIISMICLGFAHILTAQTQVSIDPGSLTVSKGDTVRMNCVVHDVEEMRGVSVHIAFNKSILRFVSAEAGEFLYGNPDGYDVFFFVTKRPIDFPDSVLIDQAIGGMSSVSGSGTLFKLCFFAESGGETTVALKNLDVRSLDNERIPSTGMGTVVTVRSGSNNAPSKPALLSPSDSTTLKSFSDTLRWSRSEDPDGDPVHYSVHISGGSTDTIITDLTDTFYSLEDVELAQLTTYFWYVQARDYASVARSEQTYRFLTPISTNVAALPSINSFEILSLAPNPATTGVWIKLHQNMSETIHISVVDITGRQVRDMLVYANTPGIHSQWIPLPNLPAGLYTCILQTQREIASAKFVLVK